MKNTLSIQQYQKKNYKYINNILKDKIKYVFVLFIYILNFEDGA